ncbi:unnamed protein product [Penicillium pancosmium]
MATIPGPQVVASANERERRSTPKSALNIHPSIPVMKDIKDQTVNETEKPKNTAKQSAFKTLGWLDRFLAVWIFLAMAIGIVWGNFVENTGPALQKGRYVGVSIPIAIGLLVMMYPILCKLALAWGFLPDEPELREGLILVGLARCIAMVLIWTSLSGGDNEYCAILVAINSLLQMVLFAPHTGARISLSYSVAAKSVAVFPGIPLGAAIITRLLRKIASPRWYDQVFLKWVGPWSLIGLLFTILVLFASQGHQAVHQIVSVIRVAAPLIVYFIIFFFATLLVAYEFGFGYRLATTQSLTAASNNFELAIAVAVSTFGANCNQALAATVGPLIEVPVLLGLVYVVKFIAQ